MKIYIQNFFKGNERSVKAKKNIIYSLFIKGISIAVGLAFVPLILNYLDAERYGIWLTLTSIIAWFSFFDIGLGNGLRNNLTEAIAKNDHKLAKTYVSTTYAILGVVLFVIIILFLIVNPLLNWQNLLNTTVVETNELAIVALIVFVFFILKFFFSLIGTILNADQRPAISNLFGPLSNLLSLIIIYILTKITKGSLINLATVLSVVPVIVLLIATFAFFIKDYRIYAPSIKNVDISKSKDLLGLGFKFFYFQISSVVFFSTTNFLIAQFSNQETVAAYNIAFKYLFMVNMIFGIILTPFWSAVTDAYVREDFIWLKNSLRKLNILSGVMVIGLVLALIISPYIYQLWIGEKLTIPFSLSLIITLYLIQQLIIAPFSTFINGLGKLKLGIFLISIKLFLFFPLAYFLGTYYGEIGIVMSMLLIQIPSLIQEPIQVFKIINNSANGMWNK
ncbi:lipopolysaccharide biosynthesis protein [Lutimonas zeaxanthinifaciens]|uniref:lipopolysaccharide biosynthesis protein n=1 Tax=Lutimonas zeaxanthinifaciens TaxID=3060215 RepID=UPI00265CF57B|nr:oligosaccharide flippase family protein [Lutimonas sp. YSD2104]WKK67572.1 oligosaccharide flippase family protein [Lutimonas sp. YSD2104]